MLSLSYLYFFIGCIWASFAITKQVQVYAFAKKRYLVLCLNLNLFLWPIAMVFALCRGLFSRSKGMSYDDQIVIWNEAHFWKKRAEKRFQPSNDLFSHIHRKWYLRIVRELRYQGLIRR